MYIVNFGVLQFLLSCDALSDAQLSFYFWIFFNFMHKSPFLESLFANRTKNGRVADKCSVDAGFAAVDEQVKIDTEHVLHFVSTDCLNEFHCRVQINLRVMSCADHSANTSL
jgi:hypothetical protein